MRKYTYLITLLALAAVFTFSNCGGDETPEKTEAEKRLEELAGAWNISTATLDGADVSSDYANMILTLTTSKGFSVSGGDFTPIWPSSGTFSFKQDGSGNDDINTIVRNDDVEITISSVSQSNLNLAFSFAVSPPCRAKGICGGYVFTFTK